MHRELPEVDVRSTCMTDGHGGRPVDRLRFDMSSYVIEALDMRSYVEDNAGKCMRWPLFVFKTSIYANLRACRRTRCVFVVFRFQHVRASIWDQLIWYAKSFNAFWSQWTHQFIDLDRFRESTWSHFGSNAPCTYQIDVIWTNGSSWRLLVTSWGLHWCVVCQCCIRIGVWVIEFRRRRQIWWKRPRAKEARYRLRTCISSLSVCLSYRKEENDVLRMQIR